MSASPLSEADISYGHTHGVIFLILSNTCHKRREKYATNLFSRTPPTWHINEACSTPWSDKQLLKTATLQHQPAAAGERELGGPPTCLLPLHFRLVGSADLLY